jgi:hypothetical protein
MSNDLPDLYHPPYRIAPGRDGQPVATAADGYAVTAWDVAAQLASLERTYRAMIAAGAPPILIRRQQRLIAARTALWAALVGDSTRYTGPSPGRVAEWGN